VQPVENTDDADEGGDSTLAIVLGVVGSVVASIIGIAIKQACRNR
jgi:hypothetical protein